MKDIEVRAEKYRIRAHRKARAHYLAAKHHSARHKYLGVPVVITTAIVGTTIFVSLSENPSIAWKITTGLLSITAAILAALQTFFKHAERSEKHKIAAAG